MAIDVTGLIIIALFFIKGYSTGLIAAIFSVVALVAGMLCALKLSQQLATWLLSHGYTTVSWAPMVSFAMLFIFVVLSVRLLAKLIQAAAEGIMLGLINRIAGGLLYGFAGAVFFSVLLWLSVKMGAVTPELIHASVGYPFFIKAAPACASIFATLLPFLKDMFQKLEVFFEALKPAN